LELIKSLVLFLFPTASNILLAYVKQTYNNKRPSANSFKEDILQQKESSDLTISESRAVQTFSKAK